MKKIELNLNFNEIRDRIELDIGARKARIWASLIGVSESFVSNIHGKSKSQNPPLPYIIAVARLTGKPIEWYLYGEMGENSIAHNISEPDGTYGTCSDSLDQWPEDLKNACRQLKQILLSDHPVIKPALQSNLAAFQHSVDKEKSQDEEIRKLSRRLEFLEGRHKAKRSTGTEGAASSSIGKRKT